MDQIWPTSHGLLISVLEHKLKCVAIISFRINYKYLTTAYKPGQISYHPSPSETGHDMLLLTVLQLENDTHKPTEEIHLSPSFVTIFGF